MSRPCVAEIDLSAVLANYQLAQKLAPESRAIAVVKANAYGHGIDKISQFLEPHVPAFAVACIEEAMLIRAAGVTKPVLLLEGIFSADEVALAVEHNFWLMIENQFQIDAILSQPQPKPLKVWIKVDTGMHRLGAPQPVFDEFYSQLKACSWVDGDIVVASHYASADELDNSSNTQQRELFKTVLNKFDSLTSSFANSAAILSEHSELSDWVRPGYMLFGGKPVDHPSALHVKNTLNLKSAVIGIREIDAGQFVGYNATWTASRTTVIATVAVGYADGYPRNMPQGTTLLVNGKKAPLVGRVSMDMLTLDVTDLDDVQIGDEVLIWGEGNPLDQVAQQAGTIGYELLTRLSARVRRIYK